MKTYFIENSDYPDMIILSKKLTLKLPLYGNLTIPTGFKFDGNSTPIGFYNLIPPHKYKIASAYHDYLCNKAENNEARKKADKTYKWILTNIYNRKVRNHIGYLGVTLGRYWHRISGHYKRKNKNA